MVVPSLVFAWLALTPVAETGHVRAEDVRLQRSNTLTPSLLQPPVNEYSQLVDREELTVKKGDVLGFYGVLGFAIVSFYCIQQKQIVELRSRVWRLLAGTGSLFITVLLFMAMKKSWKLCVGATQESKLYADLFSLVRFVVLLFGLPFLLRWRENAAWRILSTHLTGFAGADALADLLRREPFSLHASYYLLGVLSMILLLLCLLFLGKKMRGESEYNEDKERQQHEAVGFIIGFLLSMLSRFAIMGSLPGSKKAGGITMSHMIWMMAVTGAFMKLYFFVATFIRVKADNAERSPWFRRSVKILTESCAMTMAWMIFYFVQWFFWYLYAVDLTVEAGKFSTALSVAVALSVLVMLTLLVITLAAQKLARSTLRLTELDNVFSLQSGFAWEMAFYAISVSGVTAGIEDGTTKALSGMMWIVILLLLVAPPWYLLIAPKVDAETPKQEDDTKAAEVPEVPKVDAADAPKTDELKAAAATSTTPPAATPAPPAPTPAPAAPEVKEEEEEF